MMTLAVGEAPSNTAFERPDVPPRPLGLIYGGSVDEEDLHRRLSLWRRSF